MDSFQSLQSMDALNQKTISRCFVPRMHDQVRDVKHALFDIEDDGEQTHLIRNIMPFASTLRISGLYGGSEQMDLEYLEMFFTVRYYYSLQKMESMESDDIMGNDDTGCVLDVKQRYA